MATAVAKHSPLAWLQVTIPPWQDKGKMWTKGYFYSKEKQGVVVVFRHYKFCNINTPKLYFRMCDGD